MKTSRERFKSKILNVKRDTRIRDSTLRNISEEVVEVYKTLSSLVWVFIGTVVFDQVVCMNVMQSVVVTFVSR
jgi:hypothetical protein